MIANELFIRHTGNGTKSTDYFSYGANICAAANGEVIKVVDEHGDARFLGYGLVDFLTRSFVGNHVIIKHNQKEYSFYAHLMKNSVLVKVGDYVEVGQVLAKCGNSGFSAEPHLHFHVQDGANFFFSKGLPIRFSNFCKNGLQSYDPFIAVGDIIQKNHPSKWDQS